MCIRDSSLADRWIIAEFNHSVKAYREALDNFRFDIAAGILYEFTWNQFCDWYLELTKPVMNGGSAAELRGTRHTPVSSTHLDVYKRQPEKHRTAGTAAA